MKTKTRSVIVKIKTCGKSYCSTHCPYNNSYDSDDYCLLFNRYLDFSRKYEDKCLRLPECKDAETLDFTDR